MDEKETLQDFLDEIDEDFPEDEDYDEDDDDD